MDSKSLRFFLVIAEEENMSKAAERLHMSQPPLSRQLKLLEEEVGTELFERGHGRLRLTAAGIYLKEQAYEILSLLDKTKQHLQTEFREDEGDITIGTIETVGINILPKWIAEYHEKKPKVTYHVINGNTDNLMDQVVKGIYDIGIVREPFNSEPFECIRLPEEPWIAVLPKEYPIATLGKNIDLAELSRSPLILPTRAIHEEQIRRWFEMIGSKPEVVCFYSSLSSGIALVKNNVGLLLCPESASSFIGDSGLMVKKITNPALSSRSVIITRKYVTKAPAVRSFLKMIQEQLPEQNDMENE